MCSSAGSLAFSTLPGTTAEVAGIPAYPVAEGLAHHQHAARFG